MTTILKGAALALALSGGAPGAAFAQNVPDPADLALDMALAEAEGSCAPVVLDLTMEAATQVGVTLLAPCHAGEQVVLDHAGLVLVLQASGQGAFYVSLPVLAEDSPVTVTFEDGSMAETMVRPAGLEAVQDVAARW
jgi:hypothetical protein